MNLFPCLVTAPDGAVYQTCRVHFDGTTTRVWWWDRKLGDAVVVVESSHEPERQGNQGSRTYTLAVDEGVAMVRHLTGCACGHPMKRWRLPKPVTEGT